MDNKYPSLSLTISGSDPDRAWFDSILRWPLQEEEGAKIKMAEMRDEKASVQWKDSICYSIHRGITT